MLSENGTNILEVLRKELKNNNGKISIDFVEEYMQSCNVTYTTMDKTVICKVTTSTGHALIGTASTLYKKNFDEEIGKNVAFKKTYGKVWEFLGVLAGVLDV